MIETLTAGNETIIRNGKDRFLKAVNFDWTDRPPHFESVFTLSKEAFGLDFPVLNGWKEWSSAEREKRFAPMLEIYQLIVERFKWDALAVYNPWSEPETVAVTKKAFAGEIAVGGMVAGGIWAIETIKDWEAFAVMMAEDRKGIHDEAELRCRSALEMIDKMADAGADFLYLPHDVGFNGGPFVSPNDFAEIVTPYLSRIIQRVKDKGMIAIYHSDGMLMPVLDEILKCRPHALQSIDPMAGMDIAEVKKRTYGKMALMGNVACNFLQEGPLESITESALRCLSNGAPGGGYIFSSSNSIFNGVPLENYEHMLDVFNKFNISARENSCCESDLKMKTGK